MNPVPEDHADVASADAASLLSAFLHPMQLNQVFAALYARQWLHVPADACNRTDFRFGWADMEALLTRDAGNAADYRFFKGGKPIPAATLGLLNAQGALRPQALSSVIAQGITLVGNRLEYKLPAFWPLMCALQRLTGGDVCLGFVASFECPKALPVHYDYPDNIIVQTEGSKRWRLIGDPIPGSGCQRKLERAPDAPVMEIDLACGDLLFVPSGQHHLCSSDGNSLHLSLLVSWPTGLQVLKRVTRLAEEDETVCEPLRRFADDAQLLVTEQRIKARLHALIDALDTRALLDELASDAVRDERLTLPFKREAGRS